LKWRKSGGWGRSYFLSFITIISDIDNKKNEAIATLVSISCKAHVYIVTDYYRLILLIIHPDPEFDSLYLH